jgi:ADP-ribose pyrophosphatase YjhB (NUDIX family)
MSYYIPYDRRKKNIYCSNCGKYGHVYKKCFEPITSLGIIAFKVKEDENGDPKVYFLMVQRKKTLGYVEFIRGRFILDDYKTIHSLFIQMTKEEIQKISDNNFDDLWRDLWSNNDKKSRNYQLEYELSKKKFYALLGRDDKNLHYLCENIKPIWEFAEWGFPKGRRNIHENNLECAKREFAEETGFKNNDYMILKNIGLFEELFHGTNGIYYKLLYYLAKFNSSKAINSQIISHSDEISNIKWFSYEDITKVIRDCHIEKKHVIERVNKYILDNITCNTDLPTICNNIHLKKIKN